MATTVPAAYPHVMVLGRPAAAWSGRPGADPRCGEGGTASFDRSSGGGRFLLASGNGRELGAWCSPGRGAGAA